MRILLIGIAFALALHGQTCTPSYDPIQRRVICTPVTSYCSATVTTNCTPKADGSGNVAIGTTVPGGAPAGSLSVVGQYYGDGSQLTNTPKYSPFISLPTYAVKINQQKAVTVAAGATYTFFTLPSSTSGTIIDFHLEQSGTGSGVQKSTLNYYVDGSSTPLSFDLATIGNWNQAATTTYGHLRSSSTIGPNNQATGCTWRWPIYFRNGVTVTFTNNGTVSTLLYTAVYYTQDFTSDLRLRSSFVGNASAVTVNLATTDYTFYSQSSSTGIATASVGSGGSGYAVGDILNVVNGSAIGGSVKVTAVNSGVVTGISVYKAGGGYSAGTGYSTFGGSGSGATVNVGSLGTTSPGVVAGFYLSSVSNTDLNWSEAPPAIYVNGESSPSFQATGVSTFMAWTHRSAWDTPFSMPWTFQTDGAASVMLTGGTDWLDYDGGVLFTNGMAMKWLHNASADTVTFSYLLLFYQ